MRIFTALTYYRPHYSGLTIYAERLARGLAERGHTVTVLTSRYDHDLLPRERSDGVQIVRLDVGLRISKGVIMPSMPYWALKLISNSDVVHLHVPQLDAALMSLIGRILRKPVVLTYHCDLHLPKGYIHYIANQASHLANQITARNSQVVVTNTLDYAENSPFLRKYLPKIQVIYPPVELPSISESNLRDFREKAGIQAGQRIIGMAARLASEKGVEYLVQALPLILRQHPNAKVLFVGQHEDVLGEEAYAVKLRPVIQQLGDHWAFMGILSPVEFSSFLHLAEVTVLPSINSTESFGMVQVESMTCGTPVVASDLPGVRQPVMMTGMGRLVPAADADALAEAIIQVLNHPAAYHSDPVQIADIFSSASIAAQYEELFAGLIAARDEENERQDRLSNAGMY